MPDGKVEFAMEQTIAPIAEVGRLAPAFSLTDAAGRTVSLWGFKDRKNLRMVFFAPDGASDRQLLNRIKRDYAKIRAENAEVLAVGRGSAADVAGVAKDLELPYIVLADPTGGIHRLYGAAGPTTFLADRFGEIVLRLDSTGDLDEWMDKLLTRLGLIELQCPECGVPTWDQ